MIVPVLTSATYHRHAADACVPMHRHTNWELVYYAQGRGKTEIDGCAYSFSPHTYALIAPGAPHAETHEAASRVLCVVFAAADDALYPFIAVDENEMILTIMRRILSESRTQQVGYNEMLELKLRELLLEIRRQQNRTPRARKSLDYAVHYLEENYCRRIRMQDLAAEYGYGYDYFHHRFRAITGCSPQQYLLQQRMRAAQALLRDSDDSCTQIALQCGFYSSAQFSAQFRAVYGVTPSEWRKTIKSASMGRAPLAGAPLPPKGPVVNR